MEITFNQLVSNHHISLTSIAKSIGTTRQWVHIFHATQSIKRPELMRKQYLTVQQALRQWGSAALHVQASDAALLDVLRQSPINFISLSLSLGKGKWWLRDIAQGKTTPTTAERVLIAEKLRNMASILHDIVLLDFIEHDYVATHLINQNKFSGLKI